MTILKKIILVSSLSSGLALSAELNVPTKSEALADCKKSLSKVPSNMKKKYKAICECTVNNTDYNIVAELQASGDLDGLMSLVKDVTQQCD